MFPRGARALMVLNQDNVSERNKSLMVPNQDNVSLAIMCLHCLNLI